LSSPLLLADDQRAAYIGNLLLHSKFQQLVTPQLHWGL